MLNILNELKSITASSIFNTEISHWKSQDNKVIGWLCTYIPEEIIHAAGILPVRVMGGDATEFGESEAYLYSNACSFARCCAESALNHEYDFLDGLVVGTTCDHIRRLYEVWQTYFETSFAHLFSVPHKITERSHSFFRLEVGKFKDKLEEFLGSEITESSLRQAISTYNKTRILLRELYDLREAESPLVSGTEVHDIVAASTRMPREKYNRLLKALLEEINTRGESHEGNARFLLSGAVLDTSDYVEEIEDLGGLVVADELCTGSSYFWDLVDTDIEPLDAIARRYLAHAPCARMRPSTARFKHLMDMVQQYRVDGVISLKIKFCDLYGYDGVLFKKELEKRGIPVLELEREYKDCGSGQTRTRIQAFVEMLEG